MNILSKIKYLFDKPEVSYKTIMETRPTDYELVGSILPKDIPAPRNTFRGIQYHQPDVSENSCSIHGPIGALSDLTGVTFTVAQIKALWDKMKADGYASEEWGGYGWYAVDLVRNYWNSLFPNDQILSFAVETGSETYFKLLDAGYTVVHGYRWVEGYDSDWSFDRILNREWDKDLEKEVYGAFLDGGHYLRTAKTEMYKVAGNSYIDIDNYSKSPNRIRNNNNIYGIDKSVFPDICSPNKRIWHEWGYAFMFKNDIGNLDQVINRKLLERFEGEGVFNADLGKFAFIQDGIPYELNSITDLVTKFKTKDKKSSKICGLTKKDWGSLGKIIKK